MEAVPLTPRARRQLRLAQRNTSMNRRSRGDVERRDLRSTSPVASYSSTKRSLLMPRMSSPAPPRPVTPSGENKMNIIDRMPSTPPSRHHVSSSRSVVSESAAFPVEDEEMPDDEKVDTRRHRRVNSQQSLRGLHQPLLSENLGEKPLEKAQMEAQHLKTEVRRLNALLHKAHSHEIEHSTGSLRRPPTPMHNVDAADRGGGAGIHQPISHQGNDDDVSSLGGVEDSAAASSLNRLIRIIKSHRDPTGLSAEEKGLWDAVQSELQKTRKDYQSKMRGLEQDYLEASERLHQAQAQKADLEKQLESSAERISTVKRDLQASKAVLHRQGEDARREKAGSSRIVKELEEANQELEQKHNEVCAQLQEQQTEHDRAIRAIQRVLADVTTQRDTFVEQLQQEIASLKEEKEALQKKVETLSSQKDASASDQDVAALRSRAQRAFSLERDMESLKSSLVDTEKERDNLKQAVEQKGGKIAILEQELNAVKNSLNRSREKEESLAKSLDETTARAEELKKQMESMSFGEVNSSAAVASREGNAGSQEDADGLIEELRQKQASLETAKNIIASLENANGSLTADLRGKLKDREEEVTSLKDEMAHGKRTLDHLATELRDLQVQKQKLENMSDQAKTVIKKQRELQKDLEKSLSELRSAAAIHEAEAGEGNLSEDVVEQVSGVLGKLLVSLESTMAVTEVLETEGTEIDFVMDTDFDHQVVGKDGDAASKELRKQLEKQRATVKHLEDALRKQKSEMEKLRNETEEMRLHREEEEVKLNTEIRRLQDQCRTNMEVLTRKERELEVLRDSLEVSDGVGYISDDGSDTDDDENGISAINRTMSIDSSHYSHSQAEAVATLLVQGGTGIEVTGGASAASAAKLERLQKELMKANLDKEKAAKDLKQEQEALSNAKMIISSLERANKTMLEDLRSRLQDSNVAIASLLEKSSEQEKASSTLRDEMKKLKEEKEKEATEYKAEVAKLKDEQLVSAVQLAAKDRELEELKKRLLMFEKDAPVSSSVRSESVEETKESDSELRKSPPRPER